MTMYQHGVMMVVYSKEDQYMEPSLTTDGNIYATSQDFGEVGPFLTLWWGADCRDGAMVRQQNYKHAQNQEAT